MTIIGTARKTLILISLMIISSVCACYLLINGVNIIRYFSMGLMSSFLLGTITVFVPKISPFTSPLYMVINGLILGTLSLLANYIYPGIVINTLLIIIGVFCITLLMYATRTVQMTSKLSLAISVSTVVIGVTYLFDFILRLLGMRIPFIHENGSIGVGISIVTLVITVSNLLLDFSNVEQYIHNGHPKYMEWYAAFGLILTIIWMYIEIMRLLIKLTANRKQN